MYNGQWWNEKMLNAKWRKGAALPRTLAGGETAVRSR